jgi:hypothetical protein
VFLFVRLNVKGLTGGFTLALEQPGTRWFFFHRILVLLPLLLLLSVVFTCYRS